MRWLSLFLAVLLGGCAGSLFGDSESQRQAEEAKNIAPVNYKADLIAFMRIYLNDPTNIRSAAIAPPELRMVGPISRFVMCVRFNAKRGSGQYSGVKDTAAIFISGKLDRLIEFGNAGEASPLREYCAAAPYQPFPELERLTR